MLVFSLPAVKSHHDSVIVDGQITESTVKQLSIVAASKKRVHGKLQRHIQVLRLRLRPCGDSVDQGCQTLAHGIIVFGPRDNFKCLLELARQL